MRSWTFVLPIPMSCCIVVLLLSRLTRFMLGLTVNLYAKLMAIFCHRTSPCTYCVSSGLRLLLPNALSFKVIILNAGSSLKLFTDTHGMGSMDQANTSKGEYHSTVNATQGVNNISKGEANLRHSLKLHR